MLVGEFDREVGPADIEQPRHQEAQHHHDRRQGRDRLRNVVHLVDDVRVHLERLAEELFHAMAREHFLEREAGQDGACGENADRHQHPHRRLVSGLVVMLVVRLAVERLEDQAPRIERGQAGGDHRHRETVEGERIVRDIGGLDDRVLGEIAGGQREAGQRQRADHHHRIGVRYLAPQPAHVADVLLVVHRVDHRT